MPRVMAQRGWRPELGSDPEANLWCQEPMERCVLTPEQETTAKVTGRQSFAEPGFLRTDRPDRPTARRTYWAMLGPGDVDFETHSFPSQAQHQMDRHTVYPDGSAAHGRTPTFAHAGAAVWQPGRRIADQEFREAEAEFTRAETFDTGQKAAGKGTVLRACVPGRTQDASRAAAPASARQSC